MEILFSHERLEAYRVAREFGCWRTRSSAVCREATCASSSEDVGRDALCGE